MANTLKPKRSSTAAKVPTTTDLSSGELGVNMADQKIWINNGTSVVQIGSGKLSGLADVVLASLAAGQTIQWNGTNWVNAAAGAGSGTVTSVSGTGTVSGLTLTGTVTSSGNLTLGGTLAVTPSNFASQTANTILAAPDGVAGTPTFRALTATDIPALTLQNLPDAWVKRSVRAATTASITLSGAQTIDGIAVVAGDRVLVKDQTTTKDNGIYIVAAGAWTRALDADLASEMAAAVVGVDSGTTNGGFNFDNDFKVTDTLGTTGMTWSRVVDTGLASGVSPAMSGTATIGTSISYARADHIHPSDTSRAPSAGSSSITTLGTIATGTWQGTAIGPTFGGTGQTTYAIGDLLYSSAANTLAKLTGNITAVKQFLTQTGTGTASAAPAWAALANADIPTALTGKTYNALTLTAATTGFTIAGGTTSKTLTMSNTLTLAGTDASTLNIGAGGTLGSAAFTASTAYAPTAGSTSITTLGTIATGTWSATAIGATKGGTGLTSLGAANQILGVNSGATAMEYKTLTQGTGITITHGVGTVTISASGGAGTTSNALTFNNGGAGAASGSTFNGSAAVTISHNTIGALSLGGGTITTSGSSGSLIISDTGVNGSNIRLVGNGATTPNKSIRSFNGSFEIINSGYTASLLVLTDAGNLTVTGNSAANSDERLKKDWATLPADFIERLAKVKSGTYTRIDSGQRHAGASAQDMQALLKEVVIAADDEAKTLSVVYGNAALVAAVELAKDNMDLRARIAKLESLVDKLIVGA